MRRGTAGRRTDRVRRTILAVALAGALAASACGGGDGGGDSPAAALPAEPTTSPPPATTSTVPGTVPATAPPTTAPPTTTTVAPTTTTGPITTTPPSTLALDHGDDGPIAPPTDTWGDEPVVEMGVLSIPELDVSMTMYEGVRLTTLELGPGHWPGSAMPGEVGNVVVGGHRVSGHAVFRNVDDLEAGDEIVFEDDAGRHVYAVRDVQIIDPYDVWIVDPTPTPTATLFACHPPGSTSQRIAVFADLVTG